MTECFVAAGRAAWAHIVSTDFLNALQPPDRWRGCISDPGSVVLVAEVDEVVQGFVVLRNSGDLDAGDGIGEVDSCYTHPLVWGKGAGRDLLSAALERLAAMGFRGATLWTAELNHRPRRVYEAAGWRTDGSTRERTMRGSTYVEVRYRIAL
jgi:GNAT superfamily N-acetyltransferase